MESQRRRRRFLLSDYVFPNDRSGGLALRWKIEVRPTVPYKSQHFIHAKIGDSRPQFVTFVYGHPRVEGRKRVWEQIAQLKPQDFSPWFCVGDFNDITHPSDAKGM